MKQDNQMHFSVTTFFVEKKETLGNENFVFNQLFTIIHFKESKFNSLHSRAELQRDNWVAS